MYGTWDVAKRRQNTFMYCKDSHFFGGKEEWVNRGTRHSGSTSDSIVRELRSDITSIGCGLSMVVSM
jgi:hypothetical protein